MKFQFLTKEFYETYRDCKEILQKEDRPYTVCIIEIENLTFAIPIRHNIKHSYCIKTKEQKGLDFTKAVVINKYSFVSKQVAYIDQKEFEILSSQQSLLKPKLEQFLKKYRKAVKHQNDNKNKLLCQMSSLQYFHKELGIE